MSTVYDWSQFFNPLNNAIAQWGQRSQYQGLVDKLAGQGAPTQQTMQIPQNMQSSMPGQSGQVGNGPILSSDPIQGPTSLSAAPPTSAGAQMNYSGLGAASSLLPMLRNAPPSVGLPLLLNLASKNAERQQSISDARVTPLSNQEAQSMGLRPGGVYGRDISGNVVTIQQSDLQSQGRLNQELDQQKKAGVVAAQAPLTQQEIAANRLKAAEINKPVSVGFGDTLVDPVTRKPVYGGNSLTSGAVPTGSDGQPISGDQFLSTIPPQYRNQVKALGEYRQQPLTAMALRSPVGAQLSTWVNQAYPGYDASQYGAKVKARADFVSGPDGRSLTAINTAVDHLGTLGQLSQALGNGNIQAVNALGQSWAQQTGSPAPTNFEAMKAIVGDEIVKALVGTGGSSGDREHAAETISRASSPQQLAGAIQTYQQALAGKLGPLRQKYHYNTKLTDFNDMLTPTTGAVLGTLPQGDSAAPQSATSASGWGNFKVHN